MSCATIFEDKGSKRTKNVLRLMTDDTKIAAWQTFLQSKSNAKLIGSDLMTEHIPTSTLGTSKYDTVSSYVKCFFYWVDGTVRRTFSFALHAPLDTDVEYDDEVGKYKITAAVAATLTAALETLVGLTAGDLTFISGYLYNRNHSKF